MQKRRPNIYFFQAKDLDNEDLILAVENAPTYGRTRQTLDSISRLSVGYAKQHEEAAGAADSSKADNSSVIKFG